MAPKHCGTENALYKLETFSLTHTSVKGSLMYIGPKCKVIADETLLTTIEQQDLERPKALATFLSLPSSDK